MFLSNSKIKEIRKIVRMTKSVSTKAIISVKLHYRRFQSMNLGLVLASFQFVFSNNWSLTKLESLKRVNGPHKPSKNFTCLYFVSFFVPKKLVSGYFFNIFNFFVLRAFPSIHY